MAHVTNDVEAISCPSGERSSGERASFWNCEKGLIKNFRVVRCETESYMNFR